jgi:hypothetical protein
MSRSIVRRWSVPMVAVGSMIVPILFGGCFEDLGLADCERCARCRQGLFDDPLVKEFRQLGGDDPVDPGEGETVPEDADDAAADPRRDMGNRIPDAVTRPRVDPNLLGNKSPGYKLPPIPAK